VFHVAGSLLGLFCNDLAIDLSDSQHSGLRQGKGIVLSEPSVVAVRKDAKGTSKVLAVGREAKLMLDGPPAISSPFAP